MRIHIYDDYVSMSRAAAQVVALLLRTKPTARLGLATGSTPLGLYRELIRLHREGELSFSQVISFNLDEYVGLPLDAPESYHSYMNEHLFDHIDLPPGQRYIPDGSTSASWQAAAGYAASLDRWGPLDLQLLGIGDNGHIGFNEPGSSWNSRTRVLELAERTRRANARFFNDQIERVPRQAITMGIMEIVSARCVLLLASGSGKAEIVQAALYGPKTEDVPASVLQRHPDLLVMLDREAAQLLPERTKA